MSLARINSVGPMGRFFKSSMPSVFLSSFALVAAVGLTPSANAATVLPGTDYLWTPSGGAVYDFGGSIGSVTFRGLPIGGLSGFADTVVNRLDLVEAPYQSSLPVSGLIAEPPAFPIGLNSTKIQIVRLSLAAEGSFAGKIFAGLDPSRVSGGEMAIAHSEPLPEDAGGIWSSYFGINGMAVIANSGVTLTPTGDNYVGDLIANCGFASTYSCHSFSKGFEDFTRTISLDGGSIGYVADTGTSFKAEDYKWMHSPTSGHIVGPGASNFFLTGPTYHDNGSGTTHTVLADVPADVPGPLPILGVGAALSYSRRIRRMYRTGHKVA